MTSTSALLSFIFVVLSLLSASITRASAVLQHQLEDEHLSFLKATASGFSYAGKDVFLSGANLAWINYGNDFGNDQSNAIKCKLESYVRNVSKSGGNSIRVWREFSSAFRSSVRL